MSILYNYLLFDAAKAEENLEIARELNADNKSLYLVKEYDPLLEVSPYLFTVNKNASFVDWFFKEGWNQSWGTLLFSDSIFEHVYNHFRRFLMIKTETGEELYFRFYDPRVLRIFLPTCDEEQLREFFGPVLSFVCEDEDTNFALIFSFEKRVLKTQRITKENLFETSEQKNLARKFFV